MKRLTILAAALALAGCGIKTGLERPDPLWNADEARAQQAAQSAEREAARAERDARRSATTQETPEIPPTTESTTPY